MYFPRLLLLSFLCLFFATTDLFARISISQENRVRNFGDGYCAWVSMESLGRHHNLPAFAGMGQRRAALPSLVTVYDYDTRTWKKVRNNGGWDWAIEQVLASTEAKHTVQRTGNKSTGILQLADKYGAMVGMSDGVAWHHALILTEYTPNGIKYVDTNAPEYEYEASREWFHKYWTGLTAVIQPFETDLSLSKFPSGITIVSRNKR